MFNHSSSRRLQSKRQIDLALHEALQASVVHCDVLRRLLLRVQQRTKMLCPLPVGGAPSWLPAVAAVDGLRALSALHASWLRDVQTWEPIDGSIWSQIGSLSRHLLARKTVPTFMTSVWFEGHSAAARRHQHWFRHLGLGYGIRGLETPIRLTKTMGRYFKQAPDDCSIGQATRWSQVRGLGGDASLAAAIMATLLGASFEHGRYWTLVIRFFIDHRDLTIGKVDSIIEYLRRRPVFFQSQASRISNRQRAEDFLRRVSKWQAARGAWNRPAALAWKNSGIGGFEQHGERGSWNPCVWTIRELLDSNQLQEEGQAMHHCVGSYGARCASGRSSIWSLACSDNQEQHGRELTIEVDPKTRTIVQAKGKWNRQPTGEPRRVMQRWADVRGLEVEKSL